MDAHCDFGAFSIDYHPPDFCLKKLSVRHLAMEGGLPSTQLLASRHSSRAPYSSQKCVCVFDRTSPRLMDIDKNGI